MQADKARKETIRMVTEYGRGGNGGGGDEGMYSKHSLLLLAHLDLTVHTHLTVEQKGVVVDVINLSRE